MSVGLLQHHTDQGIVKAMVARPRLAQVTPWQRGGN